MTTSTQRARPATTTTARITTPTTRARTTAKAGSRPTAATAAVRTSATKSSPMPTRTEPSARALADELMVQTDLAGMEARDQWQRLATEIERRRSVADVAVRHLLDGGSEASKTFAAGVRDAVEELRTAVETAIKTLR